MIQLNTETNTSAIYSWTSTLSNKANVFKEHWLLLSVGWHFNLRSVIKSAPEFTLFCLAVNCYFNLPSVSKSIPGKTFQRHRLANVIHGEYFPSNSQCQLVWSFFSFNSILITLCAKKPWFVCVCVCVSACVHTHTYTHTCMCVCVCVFAKY